MKRLMLATRFWPGVLLAVLLVSPSEAQQPGLVRGVVVSEEAATVSKAIVSVKPLGVPMASAIPMTETDNAGRFSLDNLVLGSYGVFAKKESADYPDVSFAFYSNQVFPSVTLTAAAPSVDLILKIGPPAGVLRGSVTDAVKGSPLSAAFLLKRAADTGNWISLSQPSDYRILIPPSTEILMEVSAPGYKTFYYSGALDPLKRPPLRLTSRQEIRLDIQLVPEPKDNP